MKKEYVKPTMEIVEVQLSDCIAGSVNVIGGKAASYELGRVTSESDTWQVDEAEIF